jgi:uncharacterized protein (DUF362 family)
MCGIRAVSDRLGVPIVEFKRNSNSSRCACSAEERLNPVPPAWRGKVARLSTVTRTIHEFDVIINVPKLKAHVQMLFSGAVKNLYGCISSKVKAIRHVAVNNNCEMFCYVIHDVYRRVMPEFTVVDAIDVMEERGPRGGVIRRRGLLVGGKDGYAIDATITSMLGKTIDDVLLLKTARDSGMFAPHAVQVVGKGDLSSFRLPRELVPVSFSGPTIIRSLWGQACILLKDKFKNKS